MGKINFIQNFKKIIFIISLDDNLKVAGINVVVRLFESLIVMRKWVLLQKIWMGFYMLILIKCIVHLEVKFFIFISANFYWFFMTMKLQTVFDDFPPSNFPSYATQW